MVAYSFKPQFVAPILSGTKRQTIRADRKRHARAGELLQLYTGMRTRSCGLIGTARCRGVAEIRIDFSDDTVEVEPGPIWPSLTGSPYALDDFARADGFADWAAMRAFWQREHPGLPWFSGVAIAWEGFAAGEGWSARLTAPESPSPA